MLVICERAYLVLIFHILLTNIRGECSDIQTNNIPMKPMIISSGKWNSMQTKKLCWIQKQKYHICIKHQIENKLISYTANVYSYFGNRDSFPSVDLHIVLYVAIASKKFCYFKYFNGDCVVDTVRLGISNENFIETILE